MVLTMVAKITFPENRGRKEIIIKKPSAVTIQSSWKRLTDVATVYLPRNVKFFDKNKVKEVFRSGDPIKIELGYNGQLTSEFTGFIRRVSADTPIVIDCEDAMFKLKRQKVNVSYKSIMLEDLLKSIVTGYKIDALEVNIGSVRYANTTVSEVLEDIKQNLGLYSYMKEDTLVCGKIYADDTDINTINLHLEKSVANNTLEYLNADDVLIKLIAVSTDPKGKKTRVEVGDDDGEQRKLTYFNIASKEDLKILAEKDLKKYKVDGYKGAVATFGIPFISHGSKVNLISDLYPERNGVYYVERVDISFDSSPMFRRNVQLGEKVKNG